MALLKTLYDKDKVIYYNKNNKYVKIDISVDIAIVKSEELLYYYKNIDCITLMNMI